MAEQAEALRAKVAKINAELAAQVSAPGVADSANGTDRRSVKDLVDLAKEIGAQMAKLELSSRQRLTRTPGPR